MGRIGVGRRAYGGWEVGDACSHEATDLLGCGLWEWQRPFSSPSLASLVTANHLTVAVKLYNRPEQELGTAVRIKSLISVVPLPHPKT